MKNKNENECFSWQIDIQDSEKMVEVWLTNTEKMDPAIEAELKGLCAAYRSKKYMVAVCESGQGDLFQDSMQKTRSLRFSASMLSVTP